MKPGFVVDLTRFYVYTTNCSKKPDAAARAGCFEAVDMRGDINGRQQK